MGNLISYPDSRIVETENGKVIGRRLIYKGDRQVDAFQGIPFAKPPIGPLRFKKPEPPDSWEGILYTKNWNCRSIQRPVIFIERLWKVKTSEDCLYLNVFTPCWTPPKKGFPVMVYIHGGGFLMGDAQAHGDIGICQNLVSRDVIVVTIQYRLSYLGFFTTGDSVCPGNLGLWDQTEALKWIQKNIESFGGNKDNVTLFGQSAGGASVDLLQLSPHSNGLFHKSIPMAGNAYCPWAFSSNMVEQCKKKARLLGITDYKNSEELIEKLRVVNADKFGVNCFKQNEKDEAVDFETTPVMDGDFFPKSFEELRKEAPPKPILTGLTKEEGAFFIIGKKGTVDEFNWAIDHFVKSGDQQIKQKLSERYFGDFDLKKKQLVQALIEINSDYFMTVPLLCLAQNNIETHPDSPFYLYVFEHFNVMNLGFMRFVIPKHDASHSSELTYLFRKSIFSGLYLKHKDSHVENLFSTAFTNFAKYGNPNGRDENRTELPVKWEPVSGPTYCNHYVFTSNEPYMRERYFEGRPQQVEDILQKRK